VVLDPNGRVNTTATMLNDGDDVLLVQADFINLTSLLNQLGDLDVQRVLVEGGPSTVHRFLEAGVVDEAILIHSTVVHEKPVPSGLDAARMHKAGLTFAEETVWGEERVQRFLRAPTAR
jgi:diaminohydroxyphosphoribosylaminopyrimidine deaminase/5-amino-6-(5-phosphoribosylamino)uracil reductase